MKLVNALVLIGLFVLYGLLLFQSYHKYAEDHADHHGHSYSYSYSATKKLSDSDIDKLVNLVLIQNQTIAMLEQHILLSKEGLDQAFQDKVLAIGKLMDQLVDAAPEGGGAIDSGNSVEDDNRKSVSSIHKCPVCITSAVNSVERNSIYGSNSYSNSSITLPSTSMEKDCEKRYGLELVQQWKKNKEVWCASGSNSVVESELVCYPYHQHHKKLDGRTADVICEAKNFVIDFSKVNGICIS